jgi:hypothetical protein
MKIIDRWQDLVHTHFVTDAVRLPTERTREIKRGFAPALRASGIMFGIHFAHASHERGIRIVLECQPERSVLESLERELARVIERIPIRPPTTIGVRTASGD